MIGNDGDANRIVIRKSGMKEASATSPLGKRFVYVPPTGAGADTSRVLKRKHHDTLVEQVKQLEARVKAKRRYNEKLVQKVQEHELALEKQRELTERIHSFETRQCETQMTINMSLD